ncbi:MAG: hypothetical protein JXA30_07630 [Deltaproteobacteria bacterium]|nr:hypothetical protein [Deltaproteobacteria bacterium]
MKCSDHVLRISVIILMICACDDSGNVQAPDAPSKPIRSVQDAAIPPAANTGHTDAFVAADADDGFCQACDSVAASNPVIDSTGGYGNITAYGSVTEPAPSRGGACNYGSTGILYYAAINVDRESGDGRGQWAAGRICGQCARVRAQTPEGWKETVVRIVDKCPDQYCGIDLGGAPARALMGNRPGRYQGSWTFVACDGYENVSDGEPSISVKDGSNPWWALIQVRNPPEAVAAIAWSDPESDQAGDFQYAGEAENYYSVPEQIRTRSKVVRISVFYRDGRIQTLDIVGQALTREGAAYPLSFTDK